MYKIFDKNLEFMDIDNKIGQRFSIVRAALHEKSQRRFAEKLKISNTTLNSIENGKATPSLELINRLCKLYPKLNKLWVIDGIGEMFSTQENTLFSQKTSKNVTEIENYNMVNGGANPINFEDVELLIEEIKNLKENLQIKDKQIKNLKKPSTPKIVSVLVSNELRQTA